MMAFATVESRSISALIGFFAIFVVILFSSFLLITQLFLLQDSNSIWNDLLDGNAKFNYLVKTDEIASHNKGIRSDFFAKKTLDLSSMSNLRNDLRREKRVKKVIIIGFTAVVQAGSLVIWFPMLIKLMQCKMEKFISARRGLFLTLVGIYFAICVICGIVISILIGTQDLDDHKGTLLRGLKLISAKVINFQPGNNTASTLDTNDNGMVSLSPNTWFFIYMECLIAEGYSFSKILPAANISETAVHNVIELAKTRLSKKEKLVQINGTEYSLEWLRSLQFCPEKNTSEVMGGYLLILICLMPCVLSVILWVWYKSKSHDDLLMGDRDQKLVQVMNLGEVIGNNKELLELMDDTNPSPDIPIDTDPNKDSYIEELVSPVESSSKRSVASVSKTRKKKAKSV